VRCNRAQGVEPMTLGESVLRIGSQQGFRKLQRMRGNETKGVSIYREGTGSGRVSLTCTW
jgi:hypothetical protein